MARRFFRSSSSSSVVRRAEGIPPPEPLQPGMSYRTTSLGTMERKTSLGDNAELRLILVGKSRVGKSATGNTILGRREFESRGGKATTTLTCQRGQGRWQDRKISVVDTPNIFDSENHSEIVQNEITACVQLSQPGPHALIFVTQVGRFTAEDVTAAKRVRDIFEPESARHTIVLFTCKEDLRRESLQEYIQNSNNHNLRVLIEGYGNRYCGFNNKAAGDEWQAQVSELMEMVQRVVSENGGRHYVSWMYGLPMAATDEKAKPVPVSLMDAPLRPVDGEWGDLMMDVTAAGRRVPDSVIDAPLRPMDGECKEVTMEDTTAGTPVPDSVIDAPLRPMDGECKEVTMEDTTAGTPGEDAELRLILVGKSGGGKSATGNTILGRPVFKSVLEPKTTTLKCQRGQGSWKDRKISVVDTPDLFDSKNHNETVRCEIGACVELSRPGPHALIFVTQVGRITAEDVTAAMRVRDIFGDESVRHMIILFTYKEDLGKESLQEYVQNSKNSNLRELIRQCGNCYCGFNNKAAGGEQERQVSELMEKVQRVVLKNGGRQYVIRLHKGLKRATHEKATPDGECKDVTMEDMTAWTQGEHAELRLILVGKSGGGKRATGNTILGCPVFQSILDPNTTTVKCKWGEGRWKDRKISVVVTPDVFDSENHTESVQNEIKACIKLSWPGPHALIFVTQVGRITTEDVTAAKRVRDIFGDESTKHTIVLFTGEEELRGESMEQYVRNSKNHNLQDLIQQCGYHYCGFNNKAAGAKLERQVSLLMETVQSVISENMGRHYIIPQHKVPKAATDEKAKPGEDAELRLILVGKSGGGKSATGNTILGRPVFKSILQPNTTTLKCEKGQGSWQDRKVSVVDTPNIFDSENHNEAMRHEIGACVELSQPGPHALIFVTQVGRFTAEDVTAAKRVRDIFGNESARHTIVLFTYLEDLGGTSLQEYLQMSDNRNLRKLISGCGDRVCGFNNKAAGAKWEAQVSELMQMVQRVISENRERHYVIRLHKGPMKSPDSACANRLEMAGSIQGPERRIVLVGRTGTGKSATGNTILGSKVFGMLPMSDTKRCQKEAMQWNGRRIVVVDTPGFLDTGHPERVNAAEVSELCSPGPHVILWVMCSGSFSQEEKDMARMIKGIFNPKARNYMIILFTHKDKLEGCSSGHFMYCQDQKKYIAECGNRYLTFNNMAKGNEREAQMAELMKMIDELVFENGDALYYTEAMLKRDIENFRRTRASLFCPII